MAYGPLTPIANLHGVTNDLGHLVVEATVTATGSDGAILDGANSSIKATVKNYTNANPLAVVAVDTNGTPASFGGGTQYQDRQGSPPAAPVGTAQIVKRLDGPVPLGADGDVLAVRGTKYGAVYVTPIDGTGTIISGGGGGGGGPVTVADGADITQGALADAKVVGDNAGSVSAKLRGLNTINADVWDSVNHWFKVSVQNPSLPVTKSGTWVLDTGTNVIGKVGIDQSVSGTTNGVVVNQPLPTGANAIGKLAPNAGVNIGTVDVASVSAGTGAAAQQVQGTVAHGSAVANNPLPGAGASARDRATPVGADGQVVRISTDRYGRQQIVGTACTVKAVQMTASGSTDIIAAAGVGAGFRIRLLRAEASNSHATVAVTASLRSPSVNGGAAFGLKYLPAAGGLGVWNFPNGHITCGDNEALQANLSAGGQVEYTVYYELVAS